MKVFKIVIPFAGGVFVGSVGSFVVGLLLVQAIDRNPEIHEVLMDNGSKWLFKKMYGDEPWKPSPARNRYSPYGAFASELKIKKDKKKKV
jgi:hypothetical protein